MKTDYNRVQTLGIPAGLQQDGEACQACATEAVYRQCCRCGVSGWVIDCGHYAQPRPLAAGRQDGNDLSHIYCLDCA